MRSTIDLGRNLGLSVVAEGVEDPEVLDSAPARPRCREGYLMSRPLPGDQILAWLGEFTARSASRSLSIASVNRTAAGVTAAWRPPGLSSAPPPPAQ